LELDESRILILGANGQLGKALQAKYPRATALDHDKLDITDLDALLAYDWSDVDVIINAAAYTQVDAAETPEGREAAWRINAVGPSYLARVATEHRLTLVHTSSDYVFDGTHSPHTESEPFTPLSVYGSSKAAGDIAVAEAGNYYVLRSTWLIGDGPNFVRTMIGLAAKGISPTVVSDQIGRLTFTTTLVGAINHLLQKQAAYGTYNLTDDGEPASWADFTRAIFKELGRDDLTVTDTMTEEYFASKKANGGAIAPRPLKSEMDLSKIKAAGFELPDWHENLGKYIKGEQAKLKEG
jgi:dTDP-4-dehydrorhamnose 3,5-epimerase/reductase